MRTALCKIPTITLMLFWVTVSYQFASAATSDDHPMPPGLMILVDDHQMHIHCQGKGSPTVVMDAGLGGNSLDWVRVQPEVAKFTRVCSYDRAGYGWSEPGPLPRTSSRNATELHALLEKAGMPGPYVLVGHSYGGYNIRMFASMFPHETAGMVLVDSSHEDQFERFRSVRIAHNTAPSNINSVFFYTPPTIPESMPEDVREVAKELMSTHSAYQAARREMSSFLYSAQQVRSVNAELDVPRVVVTRGLRVWPDDVRGDRMEKLWRELQDDLASRAIGMPHLFALHGGHYVHLDEPEVVVNAIRIVMQSEYGL